MHIYIYIYVCVFVCVYVILCNNSPTNTYTSPMWWTFTLEWSADGWSKFMRNNMTVEWIFVVVNSHVRIKSELDKRKLKQWKEMYILGYIYIYIYIRGSFKKFLASPRKKNNSWGFLLWQNTTTSYKTKKTNKTKQTDSVFYFIFEWYPFKR